MCSEEVRSSSSTETSSKKIDENKNDCRTGIVTLNVLVLMEVLATTVTYCMKKVLYRKGSKGYTF
jgi:hypothetical protein